MKRFHLLVITLIMCVMSALSLFAQTPAAPAKEDATPVLSIDHKLAIREAQHKLDVITGQQKDVQVQISNLQQQITAENQRLEKLRTQAQADLDKAWAEATKGVDAMKWKADHETLTFSPVPAAPNASTKPASPPIEQAKK